MIFIDVFDKINLVSLLIVNNMMNLVVYSIGVWVIFDFSIVLIYVKILIFVGIVIIIVVVLK